MNRPFYSPSGYDLTPLSEQRIAELAARLTPEQRAVLRASATEPPFCGDLADRSEAGLYVCRLCGLPLFSSQAKFKSKTGWPSFYQPIDAAHLATRTDRSHGMVRTEILCARCMSHLGHVFEDGPPPTHRRYCLNSAALKFYPQGADLPPESRPVPAQRAYFAGGCFWGIEDRFQQVPGVITAISGYMGGHVPNPTYEQVCSGRTGHAETVKVVFDPRRVSYEKLLEWFFRFHDPTQLNRQGPDVGSQYRSAIFAVDEEQLQTARRFVAQLQASPRFRDRRIVTSIEKAPRFYPAEEYHQDYHAKHGGSCPLPGE